MDKQILGIHHVTAIAGDPQQNLNFYVGVLGLSLVKLTVNYDSLSTYHFYYGDREGRPGSLITFFPWPGMQRGIRGAGQVTVTSLRVPPGSMGYWIDRFDRYDVEHGAPAGRDGGESMTFVDRDGLMLELAEGSPAAEFDPADTIPDSHAIYGLAGVSVMVNTDATATLLSDAFGLSPLASDPGSLQSGGGTVKLIRGGETGRVGVGTVHHIAWRCGSESAVGEWRTEIARSGYKVTAIKDRTYFRSIYFRERGGALFEIATDAPGFTVDEPPEGLGRRLMLPARLESRRAEIVRLLPRIEMPR